MTSPADLRAAATGLDPLNASIMNRAALYLEQGTRYGLETAHALICDVGTNYSLKPAPVPQAVADCQRGLWHQRVATYGSIGRPATQSPPNLVRGW